MAVNDKVLNVMWQILKKLKLSIQVRVYKLDLTYSCD